MTKIWSKYITHEFLKMFCLFIFSFYFLYILIDYSSRLEYFSSISISNTLFYYLCIFLQKAEILIPFAYLITVMRVLFAITSHNELTSMLMSGLSYKRLLSPLLWMACALSILLYLNFQFFEPMAQKRIETIKQEKKSHKEQRVKSFILEDTTKIVFRKFDLSKNSLQEVYWLKSPNQIYHIQELYPYSDPPIGHYVTEFKRNDQDELEMSERIDLKPFHEMKIEFDPIIQSIFSVRTYSISGLKAALKNPKVLLNVKEHEILTLLNYKLLLPLLPIFIFMTLAPICTRFSRHVPVFMVYMFAIGGLLSFFTLMDACYFLGQAKVLPATLIIWAPALLYFSYPIWRFSRY